MSLFLLTGCFPCDNILKCLVIYVGKCLLLVLLVTNDYNHLKFNQKDLRFIIHELIGYFSLYICSMWRIICMPKRKHYYNGCLFLLGIILSHLKKWGMRSDNFYVFLQGSGFRKEKKAQLCPY